MNMEKSQLDSETSSDRGPFGQIRNHIENNSSSEGSEDEGSTESSSSKTELLSIAEEQMKQSAMVRQRWKTLRREYRDQYADLFRSTFSHSLQDDGIPTINLPQTQLGAVVWTAEEKLKLYNATSRKGKFDIPSITSAIGSKSQLEVQDYLYFIRQAERGFHLFARHVDCISHADIPAAVEISTECEEALGKAADALAAKQDEFDMAAFKSSSDALWVIDSEVARKLDAMAEDEGDPSDMEDKTVLTSTRIFQLSNFVELSEKIFMNPGGTCTDANWYHITGKDESPGLMYGVTTDFQDIITNLTRRLMQIALFLAQSRIRSLSTQGYALKSVVKQQDVKAALDVLGMKKDSWSYWVGVARRNQLNVISGTHDKGESTKRLNYDSVEAALAVKTRAYRKSQSLTTEESSMEGLENQSDVEFSSYVDERTQYQDIFQTDSPTAEQNSRSESENSFIGDEELENHELGGLAFQTTTSSRKRKQMQLDLEHDRWLEQLDRSASLREEADLWDVLGQSANTGTREEEAQKSFGPRPQVLRKAQDELRDWLGPYEAEWELFGAMLPRDSFTETEQQRKRRKMDLPSIGGIEARELPLR